MLCKANTFSCQTALPCCFIAKHTHTHKRLNRRIHLLTYIITFITSKEESYYSTSSLHTFFCASNKLWFTKANSHETVTRLKARDGSSDSGLIYDTLENDSDKAKTKMLSYDVIQLPGSILWTGVAMLISWRCFSVSVWKRRSVDPDVKAIQIPTPATAMWEITIPSSWWASKWLCKKNKDSVGRCNWKSFNLRYQLFSVGTVSLSSASRTKLASSALLRTCSDCCIWCINFPVTFFWKYIIFSMEGFSALEPKFYLMTE